MTLVLFTLPTCPKCGVIKKKLMAKGIEFTESQDIAKMESLGIKTTPAMLVNTELLTDIIELNTLVNSL